jgi:hypothetical protein
MNYIYLQEWVPSMASHYFWMDGGPVRIDHFGPKLTNNKQNLVEYRTNSLNGSPKDWCTTLNLCLCPTTWRNIATLSLLSLVIGSIYKAMNIHIYN